MKILVFSQNDNINLTDILDSFNALNVLYDIVEPNKGENAKTQCAEYFDKINSMLSENTYDAVFSLNFSPDLAEICHEKKVSYICWSDEVPFPVQFKKHLKHETNRLFLFDRCEVEKLNLEGFSNVFHLPCAVNSDKILKLTFSDEINYRYMSDFSFIGDICDSDLNALLYYANEYSKGYVEGLFQSQLKIYGCNFLEKAIPDSLIESLNNDYSKNGLNDLKITKSLLANAINNQITHVEQTILLDSLAESYCVNLYSDSEQKVSHNIKQISGLSSNEVFSAIKNSKLNLYPINRCIQSGIPAHALNILASKSVLFTNFQPELAEYFNDGESVIMYESLEDALCKADYYINNPDKLSVIADEGYNIVQKFFSYEERITQLLNICK